MVTGVQPYIYILFLLNDCIFIDIMLLVATPMNNDLDPLSVND